MSITRREMIGGMLAAACCPTLASANMQPRPADDGFKIICGLGGTPGIKGVENLRLGAPEAVHAIGWIANAIGVRPAFEVLAGDFTHGGIAMAATRGKKRYVVYDTKWFRFSDKKVGWYEVFILAHEIGHHIHGHTHGFKPSRHGGELDSDRFAGWVVARLGGSLDQALSFMPYLSDAGSLSHPPRSERIEAAIEGWRSGRRI